jgi:hypothetical protein
VLFERGSLAVLSLFIIDENHPTGNMLNLYSAPWRVLREKLA